MPDKPQKEKVVHCRFSAQDYAALQGIAKNLDLTISEVLRAAAQRMIREWAKEDVLLQQQAERR